MAKYTHADVHYRDGSTRHCCGNCTMFVPAHKDAPAEETHCTAVVDPIRSDGYCNIYKEKYGR